MALKDYIDVNVTLQVLTIFANVAFIIFDTILLLAASTSANRKNTLVPFAYITVMTINGIAGKVCLVLYYVPYLCMKRDFYAAYRLFIGAEITLVDTASYLIALFFSVLMTIHRVWVVARPTDQWTFSTQRIFIYSGLITVATLISQYIPYLSKCTLNYQPATMAYQADCAPDRHRINVFLNQIGIILPTACLIMNLSIVFHLRCIRNKTYSKIGSFLRRDHRTSTVATTESRLSQRQAAREKSMIRQSIAAAAFLSIYEIQNTMRRFFPDFYNSIPADGLLAYNYFNQSAISFLNFFVYYLQNEITKRMFKTYLGATGGNSRILDVSTVTGT